MIVCGDARTVLATMVAESVQCCVTSPPYWGLRDYGVTGQMGLERTPEEYVSRMVDVFRDVRRVLREDGTLWLNLGDSYAASAGGGMGKNSAFLDRSAGRLGVREQKMSKVAGALKPKDMVGIPWRVAFALQADGWYLRSDIIWAKPNPMPESVTDRPTKAHEYVFLLAKSERYLYDADAIAEPAIHVGRVVEYDGSQKNCAVADEINDRRTTIASTRVVGEKRNRRTVWTIPTEPYPDAHFAVMPQALVTPCVLAGSRIGDSVLDPFCGTGTVGVVAIAHGRRFIGIELNPTYVRMADDRIRDDVGLLALSMGRAGT